MLGNGIYETCAAPVGDLEITLVAGTLDSAIRFSDEFAVGRTVQYGMESSVDGNDDFEFGYGTIVSGNKLSRDRPVRTYDGTTYSTAGTRLTFDTAVNVVCTPITNGLVHAPMHDPSVITSHTMHANGLMISPHLSGTRSNANHAADRSFYLPFYKWWAGDIAAFAFSNAVDFSVGGDICIAGIYESSPSGGIGQKLAESGTFAPTTTAAYVIKAFSSNVKTPTGLIWIEFISSVANAADKWSNQNHLTGIRENNTSPVQAYYKDVTSGWSSLAATPTDMDLMTANAIPTILLQPA